MAEEPEKPMLKSRPLYAVAQVATVACFDALSAYALAASQRRPLDERIALADKVDECVDKLSGGIQSNCGDVFKQYEDCITKNKKAVITCKALKTALLDCAGKNKLGELSSD